MEPAYAKAWLVALSVMSGACGHVFRLFYKGSVFFVFIGCFKHKCCNFSTILVQFNIINITTYLGFIVHGQSVASWHGEWLTHGVYFWLKWGYSANISRCSKLIARYTLSSELNIRTKIGHKII